MAEPKDRGFGLVKPRPQIIPHKTRVRDDRGAEGMVIGVKHSYRRVLGIGMRVSVPASLIVILDSGRRVERLLSSVEVIT